MKRVFLLSLFLIIIMFSACSKDVKEPQKPTNVPVKATETQKATATVSPTQSPTPEPTKATKTSQPIAFSKGKYDGLNNDAIGWGMKKVKKAPPEIMSKDEKLIEKYNAVYMDKSKTKNIYLTFDLGYEAGYTNKILDVLKTEKVPATFFITGDYLRTEKGIIKRMIDEGHIVGNHSQKHPNMPKLADDQKIADEWLTLDKNFKEEFGVNMRYARLPMGEYSERTLAITKDLGYRTVFWSFAYVDWNKDVQKGADYAFDQITSYIHNGCIILLHAVSKDNTDALDRVIKDLRAKGYEFKSLDEIK